MGKDYVKIFMKCLWLSLGVLSLLWLLALFLGIPGFISPLFTIAGFTAVFLFSLGTYGGD